MARTRQAEEFEIQVDGQPFVWWLQRKPRWSSDPAERHGMAIGMRHAEGQREAVVEFPPAAKAQFGAPQLRATQIATTLVSKAIASALRAGWEPLSRGRTVTIVVDAAGD